LTGFDTEVRLAPAPGWWYTMTAGTTLPGADTRHVVGGTGAPVHESRATGAYNPAFDGLRWIAMSVMLAYHAGFEWGQGAAFGLSQFFTLSGFLITSLLIRTRTSTGRPDLRQFWVRRFRRLMPAAMLTLAGIVVFAIPFADGSQLAKLPGQVTSAVFYVVNWYFVLTDQSYVAQFASPSPVVHFWSLAVEEQFYLLMPLFLLLLLRRTSSLKVMGIAFGVLAVASAAWMITLYHLGVSIDRLYYGTDTRAAEFLVGAALACFLLYRPLVVTRRVDRTLTVASLAVFAITVVLWTSVSLTSPALYQGGFFVFSLLTATLITALNFGIGPLTPIFSWGPFAALGRITYGIYLVQWPIFLWIDEERTGLSRWPLLGLQLVLVLGLATASYHLIEIPIRNGRMLPGRQGLLVAGATAGVVCIGAFVVADRGPGDPLAPLAEISAAAPPELVGDGVVDVLVISDASGRDLADAMAAEASGSADIRVVEGPTFGCAPVDAPTVGCAEWRSTWRSAVESEDPDVVVLAATEWLPEDIRAASGLGPEATDEELLEWTERAIDEGVDILSEDGATVMWAPHLTADLPTHLAWTEEPFGNVMMRLPTERDDVQRLPFTHSGELGAPIDDPAFHDANALVVLDQAEAFGTARSAGTRILVVGDSLSASVGVGLDRWGRESGDATVWTTALLGCGFLYEGEIEYPLIGNRDPLPSHCRDIEAAWQRQIEEFDPDVVMVSTTAWDLVPRRLDEWDEFLEPGDPTFDAYLLDKYRAAFDILSSEGAEVVWMDGPCFNGDFQATVDYLNEVLLPQLEESRPEGLEIYPFADLVCPEGVIPDELGGVSDPRPDAVHFSPEAAYWVAQQIGPGLVE
jgi:peptidoglycan/LPS O-acetylase OafA/YrhL